MGQLVTGPYQISTFLNGNNNTSSPFESVTSFHHRAFILNELSDHHKYLPSILQALGACFKIAYSSVSRIKFLIQQRNRAK